MFLPNKKRRLEGFTLTEVLIAIVILATGLLLVIEGMGRSQNVIRIAENIVQASLLAEQKFAESEMEIRDRHKLRFGRDDGTLRIPGREFQWEKETGNYFHATIKDKTKMNKVSVAISWKEGGGRNNTLHLESLLLNRDKKA